ncbi:MAG: hypothetical protein M0Z30_22200 [Actinomycetota bacterium]|nr:hypothetical protein [Actinomycetota bacterium]
MNSDARQLAAQAMAGHFTKLELIGIGANPAETATAATVNLKLSCGSPQTCTDSQTALAAQIGAAAEQVASVPVSQSGTDIIAAIKTADAICNGARCSIALLTDGADSLLLEPGTAAQLAARYEPLLPNLHGVSVNLIGLGADGSPSDVVARTAQFWQLVLTQAGASSVHIARSL